MAHQEDNNWQDDYTSERFVGRENELQEVYTWVVRTDVIRRVYRLVGAAGTGKTWLMHALEERLQRTAEPVLHVIPIWIKVPEFVFSNNRISNEYLRDWIEKIRENLKAHSFTLPPIPSDVMEGRVIEILNDHLIGFNLRPVLLVEGYDEVSPEKAQIVSENVIGVFLSSPEPRAIIATRDDNLNPLFVIRINESLEPTRLEAQAPAEQQFEKFITEFTKTNRLDIAHPPTFDDVKRYFIGIAHQNNTQALYNWNHYFINSFIFHTSISRLVNFLGTSFDPAEIINKDDCKECCQRLIKRGRKNINTIEMKKYISVLQNIAHKMERNWSQTELQKVLEMNLQHINLLFEYGAIHRHPQKRQRYCISDGLYELLQMIPLPPIES